jgi:hypothetical protein
MLLVVQEGTEPDRIRYQKYLLQRKGMLCFTLDVKVYKVKSIFKDKHHFPDKLRVLHECTI